MNTEKINKKIGVDDLSKAAGKQLDKAIKFLAKVKDKQGVEYITSSNDPVGAISNVAYGAINVINDVYKAYKSQSKEILNECKDTLKNIRDKAKNPDLSKEEQFEYSKQEVEVIKRIAEIDQRHLFFSSVTIVTVAVAAVGMAAAVASIVLRKDK